MVQLTERQISIIRHLTAKDDFVTVRSIAGTFSVSPRTVRYDLEQIASCLKERGAVLEARPNKGIRITATQDQLEKLKKDLAKSAILTAAQRRRILALALLAHDEITYEQLADLCKQSRQTVIQSMGEVADALGRDGLKVIRSKGRGLHVQGREAAIRQTFARLVYEQAAEEWMLEYGLGKVLAEPALSISRQIIENAEQKLRIRYYDHLGIEICICFSLERIAAGHEIARASGSSLTKSQPDYAKYLSVLSPYPFAANDKDVLISVLMNASMRPVAGPVREAGGKSEADRIAGYIMGRLEELHPVDKVSRKRFIKGLTAHLQVALYRIRNHVAIRNELVDQIKISIPLLYEYTKELLQECEEKYRIRFEENEIAYIAMYVASAYEESVKLDTQTNVLLVCSFGLTTSSILKTRMEQTIPECRIAGPLSKSEAESYVRSSPVDLIISTNETDFPGIPAVRVNPLLYQDDVDVLKNKLFQISYSKVCQSFLASYAHTGRSGDAKVRIGDLVKPANIQIRDRCDSWEEAIRLTAAPLVREGAVEPRYVEKMTDAVNKLGTYMVLVPETAFIHAGTEDGIRYDCTAVLILRQPLAFGSKNPKTVRNLVVLGIKNKERNSLLELVYIFQDPKNRERLGQAGIDKETIAALHS